MTRRLPLLSSKQRSSSGLGLLTLSNAVEIIRSTNVFDEQFYRTQYMKFDPLLKFVDAISHYLAIGFTKGYQPCENFDVISTATPYKKDNNLNPLLSYCIHNAQRRGKRIPPDSKLIPAIPQITCTVYDRLGIPDFKLIPRKMSVTVPPVIDVIIPVYAGRIETLNAIYSVLSSPNITSFDLVVIDDCSPDADLTRDLRRLARDGYFRYVRNDSNLGFVRSINKALQLHEQRDAILLNSDTLVFGNWLDRLLQHRSDAVATITPFSNNASLCSFPSPFNENALENWTEARDTDAAAAVVNKAMSTEVPVGSGCCMYVSRAALRKVGAFDSKIFRSGYGEDFDFCLRASKCGFRNLNALDVFVFHRGGVSFGRRALRLKERHLKKLLQKHPGYATAVRRYALNDPAADARQRVSAFVSKVKQSEELYFTKRDRFVESIRPVKPALGKVPPNAVMRDFEAQACSPQRLTADHQVLLAEGFSDPGLTPEVSIVIAAYNKVGYTLRCLDSIRRHQEGRLEVILVDDNSSDETPHLCPQIPNLVYKKNDANKGFLLSSNLGIRSARGKYVMFLNNDTEVTPGWLRSLVQTLDANPRVGAVGSKLVYPDGTLQEAGGVYFRDGSGANFGRGDHDPDRPEYCYQREVDKCSGASLLVRRSLLDVIGGFDPRFAPAYKEDADLCFAVRQWGYSVVYQPLSKIIHHEGVSNGRDTSAGVKKYQEVNRPKFYSKWKQVLDAEHLECRRENIVPARERPYGRPVAIVVDDRVPEYDRHAGGMGMYHYIRMMNDIGFKVLFFPENRRRIEPYTEHLQQIGVEVQYGDYDFDSLLRREHSRLAFAWLSRPHPASRFFDAVKAVKDIPVIYCGRDLHYLRVQRRAALEKDSALQEQSERLYELESALFRKADAIVTFSTFEQGLIGAISGARPTRVMAPYILPLAGRREFRQRQQSVVFVGGFNHSPNTDAIKWFVRNVWPSIIKKAPATQLTIIGADPPDAVQKFQSANIRVAGHVDDLATFLLNARASVAPIRFGAGVKGKIVSAMQHGLPCVTTSVGAEGMDLKKGVHALIADTPKDFATEVLRLLSLEPLWETLSRNCEAYVSERYSYSSVESDLRLLLNELNVQLPKIM